MVSKGDDGMNNTCESNKVIERCKKKLLEGTNIESSPEEMAVLDNILFRFWQMGWLDKDTKVTAADCISRAAVLNLIEQSCCDLEYDSDNVALRKEVEALPSAQPGQRNARVFQGIVVEYPSISAYPEYEGKPYFSIKYTVNGQKFIGYGTYKPEVLSEYLKEYFMPPTQPGWIPCKTALPEHDGEYLVTIKAFTPDQVVYTDIDIARFTDGKWRKGFPVTAWCELPKPWEGEKP